MSRLANGFSDVAPKTAKRYVVQTRDMEAPPIWGSLFRLLWVMFMTGC